MTSETGSIASEMSMKMASDEGNYQHQVDESPLSETKKPICQQGLEEVSTGSHCTWWAWYDERYEAFFKQISKVSHEHYYLDFNNVSDEEQDEMHGNLALVNNAMSGNVAFPGPLVRGETDHRQVYWYILTEWQRCIKDDAIHDKVGAEMVWRMLALLWRKNGMVSGKDLAILLVQETLHDTEAPDSCDAELVELLILGKKKARSSCTNPDVLFCII
ncbi:uncharacterized protein LOC116223251 [Clupea harengus]|uniref:Uncharacterized protein LOC116223251 n=1 Tax=Clupea harengus TaxID=7950 RepID=A0A6P8GJR7_CLUHA|nr:uncharacterized protein LOC116223251 [Clupea harengus]